MKSVLALLAVVSVASAICHDSISCEVGGDVACNTVCTRQGNPSGGRCVPRDGCPGFSLCACYPRKRSAGITDGDAIIYDILPALGTVDPAATENQGNEARSEDVNKVRSEDESLEKRSVCCSLIPPAKGLCCDSHCNYIGKPGGQCVGEGDNQICTCN